MSQLGQNRLFSVRPIIVVPAYCAPASGKRELSLSRLEYATCRA